MTLLEAIPEGKLVALDTAVLIYEVESNPAFGPVVGPFFHERLDTRQNDVGSSLLTLGELLVRPLVLGRTDVANRYRTLFTGGLPGFAAWDVTREIVEEAAALRAKHKLKMIDALLVATALQNRAAIFLCNDAGLRRVTEIQVLIVGDFVTPP